MKREILFRGKRIDNGKLVYGSLHYQAVECEKQYFKDGANNHCLTMDTRPVIEVCDDSESELLCDFLVKPETIGQFAGKTDNFTGRRVFEGDILSVHIRGELYSHIGPVKFNDGMFFVALDIGKYTFVDIYEHDADIEVIGNIHDNPEMATT
jgi:uncharacterized phage protein (TIGR01671 family)